MKEITLAEFREIMAEGKEVVIGYSNKSLEDTERHFMKAAAWRVGTGGYEYPCVVIGQSEDSMTIADIPNKLTVTRIWYMPEAQAWSFHGGVIFTNGGGKPTLSLRVFLVKP